MNAEKLLDAMNGLPDDLIENTGHIRKQKKKNLWPLAAVAAACLCLLLVTGQEKDFDPAESNKEGQMSQELWDKAQPDDIPGEGGVFFYAVVVEVGETVMTLEPAGSSLEQTGSTRIEVSLEYWKLPQSPVAGDQVEILYNGEILESYPTRLGEIYEIRLLEDQP